MCFMYSPKLLTWPVPDTQSSAPAGKTPKGRRILEVCHHHIQRNFKVVENFFIIVKFVVGNEEMVRIRFQNRQIVLCID